MDRKELRKYRSELRKQYKIMLGDKFTEEEFKQAFELMQRDIKIKSNGSLVPTEFNLNYEFEEIDIL